MVSRKVGTLINANKRFGSFHQAISPVLFIVQFFGILPLKGYLHPNPSRLSFSWFSFRTFYSCAVTAFFVFQLITEVYRTLSNFAGVIILERLLSSIVVAIASINFISLARKWPDLMKMWYEVECEIERNKLKSDDTSLILKIRILALIGLLPSAVGEIIFFIAFKEQPTQCHSEENYLQYYFGILYNIMGCLNIFIKNFMDLFIVLISFGLAMKFKSINDNLFMVKGQNVPPSFWAKHRLLYRNLCILCEEVDNAISIITFVTFSSNLMYVCFSMFFIFRPSGEISDFLHALFSAAIAIFRTLCLSLFSSRINEESKVPLKILRVVPKESWCLETKRFSEEVGTDVIGLTGMKMFHITRSVVLSVTGIIITYELVLVQFQSSAYSC